MQPCAEEAAWTGFLACEECRRQILPELSGLRKGIREKGTRAAEIKKRKQELAGVVHAGILTAGVRI